MKINIDTNIPEGAYEIVGNSAATHDHATYVGDQKQLVIKADFGAKVSSRTAAALVHRVISIAKAHHVSHIALNLNSILSADMSERTASTVGFIVENALIAEYQFVKYRTAPKDGWPKIDTLTIVTNPTAEVKAAVARAVAVAKDVNACREMANTRAADMTPSIFAQSVKSLVKGLPIKVTVHDDAALKKMKAGAILAVGSGAKDKPKLIVLEYSGSTKKTEQPIVFVGKGVMFDTGGLNIKPGEAMHGMHLDMSGGAAVVHAIALAARLKIKKNIVAIVPAVENAVSNESYRPGDIVTSMSGKTIEILNTDAEGRVVLADALTYAKKFKPRAVVDVATLTGAVLIALGQYASGLLSPDDDLAHAIEKSSDVTGEPVWRLPLWAEAEARVKGSHGDVTNIDCKKSRYGGTINGAVFLWQFTKDLGCPWAHIDIASRMEAAEHDYLAPGAMGEPVRLLVNLAETL